MSFDDNFDLNFEEEFPLVAEISTNHGCSPTDIFRKPVSSLPQKLSPPRKDIQRIKFPTPSSNKSTPTKFESSNTPVRRKFPGPAGLLPDKPPRSFQDTSLLLECTKGDKSTEDEPVLSSQSYSTLFEDPPYKRLKSDFNLDSSDSHLRALTVELIKSKNSRGRKIPFIALVLDSIECGHIDVVLKLRDPTGSVNGVISVGLWKEIGHELKIGAALVLREVGVIMKAGYLLNITEPNIVAIYTPLEEGEVAVKNHQTIDCNALARHVAEWQNRVPQVTTPNRSMLGKENDLFHLPSLPHKTPPTSNLPNAASTPRPFRPSSSVNTFSPSTTSPANFDLFDDGFEEEVSSSFHKPSNSNCSMSLTQDEAAMVNEVLADLDFDDF